MKDEINKNSTNQKGITLLVLIISIIAVLILLGVGIAVYLLKGEEKVKTNSENNSYTSKNNQEISSSKSSKKKEKIGNLPSTEDTKPYLPSSEFSQKAGTDLDTGLVIQDKNGNSYVWIEVPKSIYSNEQYNSVDGASTPTNEEDYENIEKVLRNYTAQYYYIEGDDYSGESSDTWSDPFDTRIGRKRI